MPVIEPTNMTGIDDSGAFCFEQQQQKKGVEMSEYENNSSLIYMPVRYGQQKGVVRFSGPVDANRIFMLCDEIDSLISEYYYNRVCIEIDSNGGEAKSLLYFCEKLKGWRRGGVRIETMALTQCASAAAMMLSMGDIGFRSAMPKTTLVYHNARVALSQRPFTSDVLEKISTLLNKTDSDLLVMLLRHIYGTIQEDCFQLLEAFYCTLPFIEHKVDFQIFKTLNNAKVNRLIARLEKTDETAAQYKLRVEIQHAIRSSLKVIQSKCAPARNKLPLDEMPILPESYANQENVIAWLLQRFEHFHDLFTQDITICPEEALSQGLIDTIAGGNI